MLEQHGDTLDTLVSTRSTRRVVSKSDVTSQVEFGLLHIFGWFKVLWNYQQKGRSLDLLVEQHVNIGGEDLSQGGTLNTQVRRVQPVRRKPLSVERRSTAVRHKMSGRHVSEVDDDGRQSVASPASR